MIYPVAQRHLRAPRGARLADRAAVTGEHLAFLTGHLTARDRWLARVLHEHRVLTSTQLTRLAFGSARSANQRLLQLYQWRVIDRFQPFLGVGSAPMHYVLDLAGAAVLAAEDGLEPAAVGYRHDRAVGIGHSLRLAHTVGVNGLYTALVTVARHTIKPGQGSGGLGERAVTAWWHETRCARLWGDLARPDAYARWRENGTEIEFFLEYDTGTEPLTRVAGKLHDYHRLAAATAITTPILFWFPTPAREAAARQALAATLTALERPETVPVATTTAQPAAAAGPARAETAPDSPAGARWLTLDPGEHPETLGTQRARLAHLTWPHTAGPSVPASHASVGQVSETTTGPGLVIGAAGLAAPEPMPPAVMPAYLTRAAREGR